MKKIAITLSAATLLLGGLVGCGVDQQGTTGQGGAGQRGFGYHTTDQRQDTGITGQRAGEGPITDMFTRDDRRGARGFGRDARQPATGLAGERAGMRGAGQGTGMFGGGTGGATGAGQGTGIFGGTGGATGAGRGTGMFGGGTGGATGAGQGTGMFGGGTGGATGAGQGTGMFGRGTGAGAGMTGHGAGGTTGGLGTAIGRGGTTGHGTTGFHGGTGGMGTGAGIHGNAGMRGTGRGQAFGTGDHRGAGIVGNRPGYVDDRGILRERTGRTGMAGLGQGGQRMGHGQGLTGQGRGHMGQGGLGFGSREGANGRAGDRVVPGTGMSEFAYPDGLDTNTGQRGQGRNAGQRGYDAETTKNYTTRLADLENVKDSRVIVHGNRVLVGVDADGQDTQRIEQDIRQRLRGMTGDREIIVVSERDQYDQIRTADDRLRAGEPFEEVGATINAMFHDFGRAIQRPFERTR